MLAGIVNAIHKERVRVRLRADAINSASAEGTMRRKRKINRPAILIPRSWRRFFVARAVD